MRDEIKTSKYLTVLNEFSKLAGKYSHAINLGPGLPDCQFFKAKEEFSHVSDYVGNLVEDNLNKQLQYHKAVGNICEDIQKLLHNDFDINVTPNQILLTSGSQESLSILLLSLFNRGDIIIMEEATYGGVLGLCDFYGLEIVTINTLDRSISDELERALSEVKARGKKAKGLYLVPNFSNPIYKTLSINEKQQIIKIVNEHSLTLVEDDPYGHFNFSGKYSPSLFSLAGPMANIYFLTSFSKVYFPGVRLGFVLSNDEDEIEYLSNVKAFTSLNTSSISQLFIKSFLERNNHSIIKHLRAPIQNALLKRNIMYRTLREQLAPFEGDVDFELPLGGYFLNIKVPFPVGLREMKECVEKFDVLFLPVSIFTVSQNDFPSLRLSFASPSSEDVKQGTMRICHYIKYKLGELQIKNKKVMKQKKSFISFISSNQTAFVK